jgi:hypothetical protein
MAFGKARRLQSPRPRGKAHQLSLDVAGMLLYRDTGVVSVGL